MRHPPEFIVANVEVSRDGSDILIEIRTPANLVMVFRCAPKDAREAARQIEHAYWQQAKEHREP